MAEADPPDHSDPFVALSHLKSLMRPAARKAKRRLQNRAPTTAQARFALALHVCRLGRRGGWEAAIAKSALHPPFAPAARAQQRAVIGECLRRSFGTGVAQRRSALWEDSSAQRSRTRSGVENLSGIARACGSLESNA